MIEILKDKEFESNRQYNNETNKQYNYETNWQYNDAKLLTIQCGFCSELFCDDVHLLINICIVIRQ